MPTLRRLSPCVAAVFAFVVLCGCATSTVVSNSGPEPVLYGGTMLDFDIASESAFT
ncbi:MAG: hypothetical protein ACKVX7_10965 [Planctomycetota bacterium]